MVEGSGVVFSGDADSWGAAHPIPVLRDISGTALSDAFISCRRMSGGIRCYPLLRGLAVRLQAPVLHCTGTIAKQLIYFILACLPEDVAQASLRVITAITCKRKVESLYLREFCELVAAAVACPDIFSGDLEPAVF